MTDAEIIVVGAGHNALVCAGYLAKAGYKVLVIERRHKVGGAVVTEEHVPGFKFDLGGSAHILIHHTPIIQDLELEKYGLHYIDIDPLFFQPFPDGTSLTIWKDLDKTVESIAAVSPEDADNYRKFIHTWQPMAEASVEAFKNAPTPFNLVKHLGFGSKMMDDRWERLSDLIRGYGQMLRGQFEGEKVPALIAWMAAQSGPPPTEPFSAPFAIWHPMYHESGMKRPRGGSGELTQSLQRMIEAHGGSICTNMPVKRILTENGAAVGVETESGERFTASRAVVSGAHIYTTMKMLGDDFPNKARTLVNKSRIGNGFGMIVRYALDELPNYTAMPSNGSEPGPQHRAMQFICPSMSYLDAAYGDFLAGRPSSNPALISMTFSAVDPTLAPEGKHTMFLWGQYFPYELASGESWDDIGDQIADHMLDTLAEYAPNIKDAVVGKLIETPLYLERELGLLRGNVMHLEMSVDQMFLMRPALTMSNYRAPVKGLYLTGASTHPGGGIMGAAGRNAATVLLHDLSPKWWQLGGTHARS
jgi:phytoene desaturase